MDSTELEYETPDIYLAAYFTICGCVMVRKRVQGKRVFFVFTNPAGSIKQLREAFFANEGTVKAYDFSQKVKAMKELCFE